MLFRSRRSFFDEMPRIGSAGYVPSDQDILRTRVRSMGIVEERFKLEGYVLRVFDVGGQRSERKKWCVRFSGCDGKGADDVLCRIHCCALASGVHGVEC